LASSYGTNSAQRAGRPVQRAQSDVPRPGTLTAAVVTALGTAFFALVGAAVTFAAGKTMLRDMVQSLTGAKSLGSAGGLVNALIDEAYKTLQSRAIVAVVVALIVIGLAFGARGGSTAMRVLLTVGLIAAAGVMLINVRDGGVPGLIRGLDGVALACSIAGLVTVWLPANGRYASDRKALQRS
jgi:hypothetical protein